MWLVVTAVVQVVLWSCGMAGDRRVLIMLSSIGGSFTVAWLNRRKRQQEGTTRGSLVPAFLRWGSTWTVRDVVLVVLSSVVMVVGMALLENQGVWILTPILLGIVILLLTPLGKNPFEHNQD